MVGENAGLTKGQFSKIRTKLLIEREKLQRKPSDQSSFCVDRNELSDVLDEASANAQAQKELRFRNREIFYHRKINKTLERIEIGDYGLCEDCGEDINFERLMARPTAEKCIGCKEEAEFNEKNSFLLNKSKSLGKTMSELGSRVQ